MGFLDKLLGRDKKPADEAMDDSSMQSEGMHQEQQGMAQDQADSGAGMPQAEPERAAENEAQRDN